MDDRQAVLSRELVQPNLPDKDSAWVASAARAAHSAYDTVKTVVANPYIDGAAAMLIAMSAGNKWLSREKQLTSEVELTSLNCADDSMYAARKIEDATIKQIRRPPTSQVEEFSFQMPMREQPFQHDSFSSERPVQSVGAATGEAASKVYRPLVLTHQGRELELLLPQIGMPIIRQKPFGA